MTNLHRISKEDFHYYWSKEHKPVLYIKPGDKVRFEINEVTSWQINKDSSHEDLTKLDAKKFYPLSGPIYIENCKEGDTLVVEVNEVKTADWGWSGIIPDFGLLEEFTKPYLYKWDLSNERYTLFKNKIKIPKRPFCGVMGVAPKEPGLHEVMPPTKRGGNMDIKHLIAGSKLLLPVYVDGALFSLGDLHAAQGDGEVCVTAIECSGEALVTFDVIKNSKMEFPRYYSTMVNYSSYFTTTGISDDLMNATKIAVREMIKFLSDTLSLSNEEAYILCSVVGDLKIHEVVDKPNWLVGFSIPSHILE
jgi:acetamidase/formamidase